MITSYSGYECVDVTGLSGFITGEILPKRDNRGDGSWRTMRYEDLLFLHEAYLERYYLAPAQPLEAPRGRKMSQNICGFFIGSGATFISQNRFLDKDFQIPSFRSGVRNLNDILTGPVGLVPYENLGPKTHPDANYLRKMYWNISRLSRTLTLFIPATVLGTTLTTKSTQIDENGNRNVYTSTTDLSGRTLTQDYFYAYRYMGGSACSYYEFSFSGDPTPVTKSWVGVATAVFIFRTYYRTQSVTTDYYDFVSVPCTVMNGAILPSINLATIAQTILSAHGIPYYSGPTYEPDIRNVHVYFNSSGIVVDHAFPAEIDSLNWNWQPT